MECAGRGLSFWSYQMVQDLFVALPTGRCGLPAGHCADQHALSGPGRVTVPKS